MKLPAKLLVKLGGALLDDAASRNRLAAEIAAASPGRQVAVVHGGGKQMDAFLRERGVETRKINGLRVTTPEVIDAVVKVFAGTVNTAVVSAFRIAGAQPVGLTGLDAGLVDAEILDPQLGQVGRPVRSDARILDVLTQSGYTPVVACVAGNDAGEVFNVNADQLAVACAVSFGATCLVFLTDVPGVKDQNGTILPRLGAQKARNLIQNGIATAGMQAKLEAAIDALAKGVGEVIIAPGALPGVVPRLLAGEQIGTRLVHSVIPIP